MSKDDINFQVLAEFIIPIELNVFITQFWSDTTWYANFLTESLEDLEVNVGEWEEIGSWVFFFRLSVVLFAITTTHSR